MQVTILGKTLGCLAAVILLAGSARADLMITEIVDATLPGGQPKFVELKNISGTTLDMSSFSIGNFNNGGTTLGGGASTALSGSLGPGGIYVVAYEPDAAVFQSTYGFAPDFMTGAFINGDDVVAIFDGPATGDGTDANILDIYGVIGVDGSGEAWDYTDGYSFRLPTVLSGSSSFNAAEWFIGGANSLETGDDVTELALIQAVTTPGTHVMIPEPTSLALMVLAMGFVITRRRAAR